MEKVVVVASRLTKDQGKLAANAILGMFPEAEVRVIIGDYVRSEDMSDKAAELKCREIEIEHF